MSCRAPTGRGKGSTCSPSWPGDYWVGWSISIICNIFRQETTIVCSLVLTVEYSEGCSYIYDCTMSAADFAPGHLAIRKSIHRSLLAILYLEKVAPPHSFPLFAEDRMTKTYATVTKITGVRKLILQNCCYCNAFLAIFFVHILAHSNTSWLTSKASRCDK